MESVIVQTEEHQSRTYESIKAGPSVSEVIRQYNLWNDEGEFAKPSAECWSLLANQHPLGF